MDYNAWAKSALDPIHRVGRITKLYGEQGGVVIKLATASEILWKPGAQQGGRDGVGEQRGGARGGLEQEGGEMGGEGGQELEITAKTFAQITKTETLWIEIDSIATPFFVTSTKPQGAAATAITLDYIDTTQKAEMLIGQPVYIASVERQREKASDWNDLTGLKFTDQTSCKTGTVLDVIENSLNPLLLVEIQGAEHYVPLAEDLIIALDPTHIVYQLPQNFF